MASETANTTTSSQIIISGDISEANRDLEPQIKQETQSNPVEKSDETIENQNENIQTHEHDQEPRDDVLATLIDNIHKDIKQELDITENELYQESILPTKTNPDETHSLQHSSEGQDTNLGVITNVYTKSELSGGIKQENAEESTSEIIAPKYSKDQTEATTKGSESICTDGLISVKDEPVEGFESYPYSQYDGCTDEYDGSAMGHVEACLADDTDVKMENNDGYTDPEQQNLLMKLESDINVTETHLISNKLYNTTSTITRPHDGIIESQTTRTLVMEIRPCSSGDLLKVGKQPDEILSTMEDLLKYPEDTFQLNSITGNLLPLGEVEETPKESFPCPKCPKVCKSKANLQNHKKAHDSIDRFASGRARARVKMATTLRERRKKKEKLIEKHRCECGFSPCLSQLEPKNKGCSKDCRRCPRIKKKKRFPCKFCPTDYDTEKELLKHLSKHKKVQLLEYKAISEVVEGEQTLSCFICNFKFENRITELTQLKSHVMEHEGPYSCCHCTETFKTVASFATHTTKAHPELEGQSVIELLKAFARLAQSWRCDDCKINFKGADELAMHNAAEHRHYKVIPDRQCPDCRRVFATSSGLTTHRRMNHQDTFHEEQQLLLCVHCRKLCKDEKELTTHMKLHSEDRKFPCRFCDFRFPTAERRKTHMEIHTGNMRFVCFICEYRCSSENRLNNHKMSAKHLSMKEYLLNPARGQEVMQEVKEEEESEGKVKVKVKSESECDICGEKFSSEKKMLVHKQTHPFISFPNEDQPTRIFFK